MISDFQPPDKFIQLKNIFLIVSAESRSLLVLCYCSELVECEKEVGRTALRAGGINFEQFKTNCTSLSLFYVTRMFFIQISF